MCCSYFLRLMPRVGHTPKHSLALTAFSFDRGRDKSSWHLKLTDKIKSVLFFCFGHKGSVYNVILSLLLFCSVGGIRYVRFPCCREVSIGRAGSDSCDKLWTTVRSKHGLLTFRICCVLVTAQCLLKGSLSNIMITLSGNKFQHLLLALRKQWALHNRQPR